MKLIKITKINKNKDTDDLTSITQDSKTRLDLIPVNSVFIVDFHSEEDSIIEKNVLFLMKNTGPVPLPEDYFNKVNSQKKIVKPSDLEQSVCLAHLFNDEIKMVIVGGPAGTGKTFLSLSAAYSMLHDPDYKYKKIILAKPRIQVTEEDRFAVGELPGGIDEKMAPQMLSFLNAFEKIVGGNRKNAIMMWEGFIREGKIQIIPIEFMRGIDFSDSIVIVDECQNMGISQFKTIATRLNETSKFICIGDYHQSDLKKTIHKNDFPYIKASKNPAYRNSDFTSIVDLVNVKRSRLTKLMNDIFNE